MAHAAGADVVRATIYDLDLPMFRTDWKLEQYPPTLPWLLDQIRQADGLIICSPTYHGTMSGAIKNLLDMLIFLGWDKPPSEEEIAREARRLKERGYPTTRPEDDR